MVFNLATCILNMQAIQYVNLFGSFVTVLQLGYLRMLHKHNEQKVKTNALQGFCDLEWRLILPLCQTIIVIHYTAQFYH